MKVVILGKGEMLANLIEGVIDAGFDIVGVFRHERTTSKHILLTDFFNSSPELALIKKYKLHEIKCKSANSKEFKKEILRLNVDIILVGTWHEKIKKDIIDIPTIATINVHPSLLPAYRGPNPYIQTILHGEKYSGITFHLMTEKLDQGPILAQQKIEILPFDTAKELKEKTVFSARLLSSALLKKLNIGIVQPTTQNEENASYFGNLSGNEKMLSFKNMTSDEIFNTIHALHPYLPTYITYKNIFLITNPYRIQKTDKSGEAGKIISKNEKTRSLTIACKDGKCLKLSHLRAYHISPLTGLIIKLFIKQNEFVQ